jgi:hypothetical protein
MFCVVVRTREACMLSMSSKPVSTALATIAMLYLVQPSMAEERTGETQFALSRKNAPARSVGDPNAGGTDLTDAGNSSQGTSSSLPPPPSQNVDMTWDGDRLRPNDPRRKFSSYARSRTALTAFEIRPFERSSAGGYRGCFLVPDGASLNVYGYGWDTRRVEVCN